MSSPLSIDVLPTIDTLVDNNASREQIISLGAQQIRRLREDLRAGANATPEQQRKLERLQAVIGTRIALVEAAADVSDVTRKEIVAELKTLREVMDKRFILPDYAPDAPDAVRKTLQFTAGSLDVGIRTLNAATRDLPTAARVGIFAGVGVATVLAVKWLWDELGVIGKAVGTGIAGAAGFLGFQKLQENWTAIGGFFTNMRDKVRGWLGGGSTEHQEKIHKQQKVREAEIQKNTAQMLQNIPTGQTLGLADSRLTTNDQNLNPNILALTGRTLEIGGLPFQFENVGTDNRSNYILVVNGSRYKLEAHYGMWLDLGTLLKNAQIVTINNERYIRANNPEEIYVPVQQMQRILQAINNGGANSVIPVNNLHVCRPGAPTSATPEVFAVTNANGQPVSIVKEQTWQIRLTRQ